MCRFCAFIMRLETDFKFSHTDNSMKFILLFIKFYRQKTMKNIYTLHNQKNFFIKSEKILNKMYF